MKSAIIDFCKIASMLKLAKLNDDQFKDIQKFRAYVLDPYFPSLVESFNKSLPDISLFNINDHIENLKTKVSTVSKEKSTDEDIEQFLQLEATDDLSYIFMEMFIDFYNDNYVSSKHFGETLLSVAETEERTNVGGSDREFQYSQVQESLRKNTPSTTISKRDIKRERAKKRLVPIDITASMGEIINSYLLLVSADVDLVKDFISEYRAIKNLLPDAPDVIDYKINTTYNKALSAFHKIYEKYIGSRTEEAVDTGVVYETSQPLIEKFEIAKSIRESDMFDIVFQFTRFLKDNKSKTSIRNITDAFSACVESNCDPDNAYQFLTDYIQNIQ